MDRLVPAHSRCTLVSIVLLAALATTVGCDRETGGDSPAESASAPSDKETAGADQPDATAASAEASDEDDRGGNNRGRAEQAADSPGPLRGRVSPGDVTERSPAWRERLDEVEISESMARKLEDVPPGAEVTVYFGPWCPDSRRAVPQLWNALEAAGGDVAFSVEYIALDSDFEAGDAVDLEEADIDYVPTFVVHRDGKEAGRIVESAPGDFIDDLHALLTGDKSGVLSGRSDL